MVCRAVEYRASHPCLRQSSVADLRVKVARDWNPCLSVICHSSMGGWIWGHWPMHILNWLWTGVAVAAHGVIVDRRSLWLPPVVDLLMGWSHFICFYIGQRSELS